MKKDACFTAETQTLRARRKFVKRTLRTQRLGGRDLLSITDVNY